VNAADSETGATPLMIAASMGRTEAIESLLKGGAQVRLRDRQGRTALDRAHEAGSADSEKILQEALKTTTASSR
jgi:ankyrin repeat protein